MSCKLLPAGLLAFSLALTGCGGAEEGNQASEANTAQGAAGAEGADQTIAASLDQNSRFSQAIKAAGLDATLAGPGPYTVLVPDDQAFARMPEGTMDELMRPEARARLTDVLTYHILPGTVLVEDIGRAIENANGRAILATMGGETLQATRDGERIVLIDSAGNRATIARGDERRSNGVVHYIDGVLMPGEGAEAEQQQEQGQEPAQQ
jgi:uncharacterized surface protein with fasciclin (FAS1) repeats